MIPPTATLIAFHPTPSQFPTLVPLPTTTTAPTIIYLTRTIIRKQFSGKYYKGENTSYNSINNFKKIKYHDGDTKEFTPN